MNKYELMTLLHLYETGVGHGMEGRDYSRCHEGLHQQAYKEGLRFGQSRQNDRSGLIDQGPWSTGADSTGEVYLESEDFTRDVRLYVNGDFASATEKLGYAHNLAQQINFGAPVGQLRSVDLGLRAYLIHNVSMDGLYAVAIEPLEHPLEPGEPVPAPGQRELHPASLMLTLHNREGAQALIDALERAKQEMGHAEASQ